MAKTNPYAPPSSEIADPVDSEMLRLAAQTAKSLAKNGWAVGSIAMKLRWKGLNDVDAERIAIQAVLSAEQSSRIIALGLVAIAILPLWLGLNIGPGFIPGLILFSGSGIAIFALERLLRPSKIHNGAKRSK